MSRRNASFREILRPFEAALQRQTDAGLLRIDRPAEKPTARLIRLATGKTCVDFSSNSYLGLHETIAARVARRFVREGHLTSAGSSRMVSGTRDIHRHLEEQLARFLGAEDAAVYGSGFLTCMSVISTLAGSRDRILFDEKCHASLHAGITLSGARAAAYRHGSCEDLESKLGNIAAPGQTFIVTEGLFSMDGDMAPLKGLSRIANRRGAWLVVDDAHGIGATGTAGRGSFEESLAASALEPHHILLGTLSKTLASYGGFVAANATLIRYLKARAREFIYTTGAPVFQIIAALEALAVIQSPKGRRLRKKLGRHIRQIGKILKRPGGGPIVPVPIPGGPDAVLDAARQLQDAGCFAVGMRYPTVPRGREMIRVSLSAAHTEQDVRQLAVALRRIGAL